MYDILASNYDLESKFVIDLFNSLEDEIKTVIDASVPNKIQNKAAQKVAAGYFFQYRQYVADYLERKASHIMRNPA